MELKVEAAASASEALVKVRMAAKNLTIVQAVALRIAFDTGDRHTFDSIICTLMHLASVEMFLINEADDNDD